METFKKSFFLIASVFLLFPVGKSNLFVLDAEAVNPTFRTDRERFVEMEESGLTIHYHVIGKGPIDMVFLPGWTNPLTVFSKQFDYFRDKVRCFYIDLPEQGLSDAPAPATPLNYNANDFQYTMELMAEAVYRVIKTEGLKHFVAVGFSMGSKVWGAFERNHPDMIYQLLLLHIDQQIVKSD